MAKAMRDEQLGIRHAAEQGHAAAQRSLCSAYKMGKGVEQDLCEALMWLNKAADQDDNVARNILGMMYITGERDVKPDILKAKELFHTAAEQGCPCGAFNLAYYFHLRGLHVEPPDFREAEDLMAKSAHYENALRCTIVIVHERDWGEWVKDELKAAEIYETDDEWPESKTLLGKMYEDGRGELDQDLNKAAQLYTEAVVEDVVARGHLGQM
ncbi:hypothetical protein M427DRAFT_43460 [Gonapodya prolifera JEL478]|uniref:HCP-like protein n=1 Tax=Gonapodya prolifera (strain JEL478) TaxID=1344416 RepID=A0A139AIP2_GONPJ|nr:hypothetical protein M427DRAFT_43460 [Gonapodya prolifera JEL478]|eukprot:KXS16660.1 hypothetical protein M427DRAFT_43460 [Gonapodya prolifera JEL478]